MINYLIFVYFFKIKDCLIEIFNKISKIYVVKISQFIRKTNYELKKTLIMMIIIYFLRS